MHMLYNSDSFVVMQFEVPAEAGAPEAAHTLMRGGYEIVDKFACKEIFIEGAMAESFREMDAYIERYSSLMQHPVVLH